MDSKLPIKLLTFDLDDTLWEFAPVLWRAEETTYAWLEQHAPLLTARFSLTALRELRLQIAREQPELAHRVTELRIAGLRRALQQVEIATADIEALAQAAFEIFLEARHRVELFDAAEEVLDQLSREYILAAITNGNVQIKKLGLDRFFALAINAEQLPRAKPHPEPFLAALQQIGCAPAQCIHIGDDIENDIRGAQRVGLHTVWMNPARQLWPGGEPPSQEIQDLLQLPAAIDKITKRV
ncbi:MAG TPA: HAD family hydrolase [Spongiibacteraceae bacterium]|nr:HAD family hydrolase [Spongiibacteraceae bacterium]